jgi:hydrogenase 3 maturation protease
LVRRLAGQVGAVCIDAGSAPENYAGKIIKENPDTILLIDAAHLDGPPGSWDILNKRDIAKCGFTTHDFPPSLLMEYLTHHTKAKIYLLAVEPEDITLGEGISGTVEKTLRSFEQDFKEILPCTKPI